MQQYATHLSEEDIAELARATEGMSGRDLRDIAEQSERRTASKVKHYITQPIQGIEVLSIRHPCDLPGWTSTIACAWRIALAWLPRCVLDSCDWVGCMLALSDRGVGADSEGPAAQGDAARPGRLPEGCSKA